MKQTILIISLAIACMQLNAQSKKTIYLNNGEQIEFLRLKGKKSNIIYKTPTGTKHTLNYDEFHFALKNKTVFVPGESMGTKYLKEGVLIMDKNAVQPGESCTEGMVDGISNTNYMGARIGGIATGFLFPIGLIGTAAIAATPPNEKNFNYPQDAPLSDPMYKSCFKKSAKKQKSYNAWLGGTLGVSLAIAVAAAIMSSAN